MVFTPESTRLQADHYHHGKRCYANWRSYMTCIKYSALLLLILLSSCSSTPEGSPEFFIIHSSNSRPGQSVYEDIVAANPPRSREALRLAIEAFNRETMSAEEMEQFRSWNRTFFLETRYMTRDFVEGEPYPQSAINTWWYFTNHFGSDQRVANHLNDVIFSTRFARNLRGGWNYRYLFRLWRTITHDLDGQPGGLF